MDFAVVEFACFSFNLVVEASAGNYILRSERCPYYSYGVRLAERPLDSKVLASQDLHF